MNILQTKNNEISNGIHFFKFIFFSIQYRNFLLAQIGPSQLLWQVGQNILTKNVFFFKTDCCVYM